MYLPLPLSSPPFPLKKKQNNKQNTTNMSLLFQLISITTSTVDISLGLMTLSSYGSLAPRRLLILRKKPCSSAFIA